MRRLLRASVPIAAFVLVACSDATEPERSTPTLEAIEAATIRYVGEPLDPDEQIARLDEAAEGLGGFSFDPSGNLTLHLRGTHNQENRVRIARAYFESKRRSPAAVRVLSADYTFGQLLEWKKKLSQNMPSRITRLEVSSARNRIHVGVKDPAHVGEVQTRLTSLGIPTAATIVEPFEAFVIGCPENSCSGYSQGTAGAVRPLAAGAQIELRTTGAGGFCTMGPLAVRMRYDFNYGFLAPEYQADKFFMTASHCTRTSGSMDFDYAFQPNASSNNNYVATEYLDPPMFQSHQDSRCPSGRRCRYSDVALFRIDQFLWSQSEIGKVLTTVNNDPSNINGSHMLDDQFAVWPGDLIYKTGAMSGSTYGWVSANCTDINLHKRDANGQLIDTGNTLLCASIASAEGVVGDSGAPIWGFYNNQTSQYLVGVMSSGNGSWIAFSNWSWAWHELRQATLSGGGPGWATCELPAPGTYCR